MVRRRAASVLVAIVLAAIMAGSLLAAGSPPAADAQARYDPISGEGSTWAQIAIDYMRVDVDQFGITVDYAGTGSTNGRKNFIRGVVDFAASDIPFQFQPEDGSAPDQRAPGTYAYIPVTAGGTAFMYNLKINGQRVTNLRLSGENVAKIFAGVITRWNDPALQDDNPGLALPDRQLVPIVRSDGSGSTAQFTRWMIAQHGGIWNDYCQRSDRAPACGQTSFYPTISGMVAQSGDPGVAQYVSDGSHEGTIGYVNYSYALGENFPVVKVLNAAGYYTEPTPDNVAVSLLKAQINRDEASPDYLTQQLEGVYTDPDPRNYQLSSYSYFILPTVTSDRFTTGKGRTLGAFAYNAMCQSQHAMASLGYSPMPINLVEASFEQIRKIPGVEAQEVDISKCNNPTFSPDGTNLLAQNAAQPQECDRRGPSQCATGTGGLKAPTPVTGGGGGGGGGQEAGTGDTGGTAADGSGDGATGTATGTGGGTTGNGSSVDGGAGTGACDPDTGLCGSSTGSGLAAGGRTAVGGAGERAIASPSVLAGSSGRSTMALVALVLVLVLALVFAPAVAWRHLANGPRT